MDDGCRGRCVAGLVTLTRAQSALARACIYLEPQHDGRWGCGNAPRPRAQPLSRSSANRGFTCVLVPGQTREIGALGLSRAWSFRSILD